jgi:hypothetical protein
MAWITMGQKLLKEIIKYSVMILYSKQNLKLQTKNT